MNSSAEKKIPVLGITMGDPAGIGPEIIVHALSDSAIFRQCHPLVIGDAAVMRQAMQLCRAALKLDIVSDIAAHKFRPDTISILDLKNVEIASLVPGEVSAMAGNAAFEAVKKVIGLALAKTIDATVTGPIHKESINIAGHKFSGHTEIYAHYTNTKKYAMLLVHENLRVIHVSTHVSLREACDLVKKERILDVIALLHEACKRFGISSPRIGVAGLNPHAGDGGLFGDEEKKEITPAIQEARQAGYKVSGPIPADTLFTKAKGGLFDGCVAMYHDQGHIPFKVEGFQWDPEKQQMASVSGVNITLGLPIIRTSVDHGTAFDIAGKGIASPDALKLAVEYAAQMVRVAAQRVTKD